MQCRVTNETLELIRQCASRFARTHKLNADDVESYLCEAMIPVLNRYNEALGVPISAYVRSNAKNLCKNYLRDEAGDVQILRKQKYVAVSEQTLFKQKPHLQGLAPKIIAKELGMSEQDFLAAKQAIRSVRAASLDEHAFLLNELADSSKEASLFSDDLIEFMQALSDTDMLLLENLLAGKHLSHANKGMAYNLLQRIVELHCDSI